MAYNFRLYPQLVYQGALFTVPTTWMGGTQVIVAQVNWVTYGTGNGANKLPNLGILLNWGALGAGRVSVNYKARSIYVDNLGCQTPIYIYFPDTGFTVVAQPNSASWLPMFTNGQECYLFGLGFTDAQQPLTNVFITDANIIPFADLELPQVAQLLKASPTITRGNSILNTNYGTPALGDQFFSSAFLSFGGANTVGMWNTPYPSGFLYITGLQVIGVELTTGSASPGTAQYVIESTGLAGVLLNQTIVAIPGTGPFQNAPQIIAPMNNMQLKLDATQTWRMRVVIGAGTGGIQALSAFTQSPI